MPVLPALSQAIAPAAAATGGEHTRELQPGSGYLQHVQADRLFSLSDSLDDIFSLTYPALQGRAERAGLRMSFTSQEGVRYALRHFENDLPVFMKTLNAGAASTSAAQTLYPGGSRKLFVTGKNIPAGVWDSGRVLAGHPEFGDRVVNVDTELAVDDHATHVAGTMVAAGLNPQVRGMAYEGSLRAFDWKNDLAEMAREAGNGMLISNHSYGISLGWDLRDGEWKWMGSSSAQDDYRFGFYGELSRSIDHLTFLAPYYLVVWAAGNDRSDVGDGTKPADGPYDTIGPEGVAKNVLTIGAVEEIPGGYTRPSDVVMSSFSSWGPADDGRVKPDLVTKGRQLISTGLQNSYTTKSGTSMAAPVASGILMLIQQLYYDITRGSYLRAATLKGLAIHTASHAGVSPGPDYIFGWGLMHAGNMADFLLNHGQEGLLLAEHVLANGSSYEYAFVSDGTTPLKATLSWADVSGPVIPQALNPRTPALVNDLDMRLVHDDGTTYFPWVLDPGNPMAEASRGDNARDNVEKIWVESPPPGNYRLVITHKNQLSSDDIHYALFLEYKKLEQQRTLYWIGRNGSWHDGGNWSLVSGGAPAGIIPGASDHVVVDRLSFSEPGQLLQLNETASCFSLTVAEDTRGRIDLNGYDLMVTTSLLAHVPFYSEAGRINRVIFSGDRPYSVVSIDSIQPGDTPPELIFDNEQGEWRIMSDMSASHIVLKSGRLIFSDVHVLAGALLAEDNNVFKHIDLGTARISGLQQVAFPATATDILGENATFEFSEQDNSGKPAYSLHTGGMQIGTLINHQGLDISGELVAGRVENHGPVVIHDDLRAHEVVFTSGAAFLLSDSVRLLVGEKFEGSGEAGKLVPFTGTGQGTEIIGMYNGIFCLDYVEISGLPFSGQGVYNAGAHSVVTNSPGWQAVACEDVGYADFSFTAACRGSWTLFKDESRGEITSWDWQFGNLGGSPLQNPYFTFTEMGSYPVSLTVQADDFSHTMQKNVSIVNNPLPEVSIAVLDNMYFVNLTGFSYQWYRDGVAIPGATGRIFNNTSNLTGEFVVLISNQQCNRPSEKHLVVSTQEPEKPLETFDAYPNPAGSYVVIESAEPIERLEIMDMSGKKVLLHEHIGLYFVADTSGLPAGTYIISAAIHGKTSYHKVIINPKP